MCFVITAFCTFRDQDKLTAIKRRTAPDGAGRPPRPEKETCMSAAASIRRVVEGCGDWERLCLVRK